LSNLQNGHSCINQSRPTISVIIVTRDRTAALERCLEAIAAQTVAPQEVIVVDNSSDQATFDLCQRWTTITYVNKRGRHSITLGRQAGLEHARGDIVAWTDDDARPVPHWIERLLQYFQDPSVGVVGGPQILPASRGAPVVPPDSPVGVLRNGCIIGNFTLLPDHVLSVEHVMGVNMSFRREAALAQGGFDQFYISDVDDTDITYSFYAAGYRVLYAPDVVVYHDAVSRSRAVGRRFGLRYHYRMARSTAYFFVRHFGLRSPQLAAHVVGQTTADLGRIVAPLRLHSGEVRRKSLIKGSVFAFFMISGRTVGLVRGLWNRSPKTSPSFPP